jgi:hypothetical protein
MSEKANDPMKSLKSAVFDVVFKSLIGVVLWLVLDMHSDLKHVLQEIPVIQKEIEFLKDKSLIDRFKSLELPPVGKHEDFITYDSLQHK